MENKKTMPAIAFGLIFLFLCTIGFFYSSNCTLKENLNNQKELAQGLIMEKTLLNKELSSYKKNVSDLSGEKQNLQNMLDVSNFKLSNNNLEIKNLKKENSSIKSLRSQITQLKQMNANAQNMAEANKKQMQSEISSLNSTVSSLRNDNKELSDNVELLRSVTADNFTMQTTKRKERLTVIARRTREMKVSFEVPQGIETQINFNIIAPDGTKLSGNNDGISFVITDNPNAIFTASSNDNNPLKLSKKVEMTYQPKQKLKAGDYTIEMTNKNIHVAYCHVKLR
ncbi:MAG: hypothetical protein ABIT08_01075 [Bacteroidia bacterium]